MVELNPDDGWDELDDDWMVGSPQIATNPPSQESVASALVMVETAFLASTTALIWLISTYIPSGPLMRMFFPLPVALSCMRWGKRAGWMTAIVSGLLITVLMGPPRSIQFFLPYGMLGVVLGNCWKSQKSWSISMGLGIVISAVGLFFQIALLSLLLGTNVWLYLNQQVIGILDWLILKLNLLLDFLFGFNLLYDPNLLTVQFFAVILIFINALLYCLLVHLVASLLFERLNYPLPDPPKWLAALLEN